MNEEKYNELLVNFTAMTYVDFIKTVIILFILNELHYEWFIYIQLVILTYILPPIVAILLSRHKHKDILP